MTKCLRCGRKLTSQLSIERGYGKTCFRIVNANKPIPNNDSDIEFLKMEIKALKRMIRNIKISSEKGIERIKNTRPEVITIEHKNMSCVMNELKSIFKSRDWKNSALHSIQGRTEIVEPPNLYV